MTKNIIIQIYEIQTPIEAEAMVRLGVDHIGSVVLPKDGWKTPSLKETIEVVQAKGAKSSLIPLFSDWDMVRRCLAYYRPDLVHFCESLLENDGRKIDISSVLSLQKKVRKAFPSIEVIRTIPIAPEGFSHQVPTMELAEAFEPHSDFFLTDTFLVNGSQPGVQPVTGFVGITGKTCDWDMGAGLVSKSQIPVILAGGLSPENVTEGIRRTRPDGVDSCTCTNALNPKGQPIRFQKDPDRVRRMVEAVRKMEKI